MGNYSCSLVISVYNQAQQLRLVLDTVARQTAHDFEIIVADDGSADDVPGVLAEFRQRIPALPVRHIWHEDRGFFKTVILNEAFRTAEAGYIVVVDGDMLLHPNFIENHLLFRGEDRVLCGYRGVKLGAAYAGRLLAGETVFSPALTSILYHALRGELERPLRGMTVHPPLLRSFMVPGRQNLSGCNFSLYRAALEAVNGMDASILEYGFEDFELGCRLIRSGYSLYNASKCCNTYHLDHEKSGRKVVSDIKARIQASAERQCRHGLRELDHGSSVSDFVIPE